MLNVTLICNPKQHNFRQVKDGSRKLPYAVFSQVLDDNNELVYGLTYSFIINQVAKTRVNNVAKPRIFVTFREAVECFKLETGLDLVIA